MDENSNGNSDDGIIWGIIGIIVILGGLYFSFGCNIHVFWYDSQIDPLKDKYNVLECNIASELNSAKNIRCRELVYEINKLVNERNNLFCVSKSS